MNSQKMTESTIRSPEVSKILEQAEKGEKEIQQYEDQRKQALRPAIQNLKRARADYEKESRIQDEKHDRIMKSYSSVFE